MSAERKPSLDPTVGVLSLHIPSSSGHQLWFALVELGFHNYKTTGNVSRWVAGRFPLDLTLQKRDVIVSSLSHDALKVVVVTRTAPPDARRTRQLLQRIKLGNNKSLELSQELRPLGGAPLRENPM